MRWRLTSRRALLIWARADGLGPFAARGEHLSVDFDGGALCMSSQGSSSVLPHQEAGGHFGGLLRQRINLIEILKIKYAPGQPGDGGGGFRVGPMRA